MLIESIDDLPGKQRVRYARISEMMTKFEHNNPIEAPDDSAGRSPAVDPNVLNSIRAMQDDDDPNLLCEMIALYLQASDKALETLRAPDITSEPDELRKIAHSLKGSSASIGATRLAACCLVIEKLCQQEKLDRFSSILIQLEKEYQAVQTSLFAEIQGKAA